MYNGESKPQNSLKNAQLDFSYNYCYEYCCLLRNNINRNPARTLPNELGRSCCIAYKREDTHIKEYGCIDASPSNSSHFRPHITNSCPGPAIIKRPYRCRNCNSLYNDFYHTIDKDYSNAHLSYKEIQSKKNFYNQNSYFSSKNIDMYKKYNPIETPPSITCEKVYFPDLEVCCGGPKSEAFFENAVCSQMIFRALVFKLIGRENADVWLGSLGSMILFLPKTLLLGYILLLKLTTSISFDSPAEISQAYLSCCITAAKTQYDGHISNIDFVNDVSTVRRINYIEGLILNCLQYNIGITNGEVCSAIAEVIRIGS